MWYVCYNTGGGSSAILTSNSGWTDDTKEYTSWWLLPEENAYGIPNGSIYPKAVFQMGEIQFHGRNISHIDFTIRPCVRIKFKND